MGKSIGVVSLKGGVGKTSIVVALGSAIADLDKKVLLVDGNFSAPNLGLHFKVLEPKKTLHHVMNRNIRVRDSVHNVGNLDIIPSSIFTDKQINPLKLKERMKYLKNKYDYIIYDSSPTLNDETLGVMIASDSLLVVTTPDHPTLSTTIKAVKAANKNGVPIEGLIINKFHNKKFEVPLEHIEESINMPVLAVIPYDINVLRALAEFKDSFHYKSKSEVSREFKRLAYALVGKKEKSKRFFGFLRKFKPKKQEINRLVLYQRIFEE